MFVLYVIQQLTIYVGFFLLIIGVIGNTINIFIFLTQRNYRQTGTSFLFLVGSINDTIYLLFNLTLRILSTGYEIKTFDKYLIVCRIRSSLILILTFISLTCYCLASINQFFSTSRSLRLRQFGDIKWTYRVLLILILIWIGHGIPEYFYNNISPTLNMCAVTDSGYINYATIALLTLLFGLPVLVLIIFGYLSYRNIRQIRAVSDQQIDRQLTLMTIMQATLVCFSTVPYGVFYVYSVITVDIPKDLDQQLNEYLIGTIVILISYCHFAGSFYVYLFSSKRFRETVKTHLFSCCNRHNNIHPIQIR